jgi:ABC-type bacteriocin/lantibiotic exporter with double-glycine peptidase domain
VSDVSFRYGRNPWIFQDLSFGIDLESRVCIVGANGSGKTTLLKLMTGVLAVRETETQDTRKRK